MEIVGSLAGNPACLPRLVTYQEIDVTVNVPATVTTGHKKISLYDAYSPNYGYYGRGSCPACLTVN